MDRRIVMSIELQPTTAMFPGLMIHKAMEAIDELRKEYMQLGRQCVQICPQSYGVFTEDTARNLAQRYPDVAFQLHSNVRISLGKQPVHANSRGAWAEQYLKEYDQLSKVLGASVYSLHAGERKESSLEEMFDIVREWNSRYRTTIAVEGMYPDRRQRYLLSSWDEYARLLEANIPFAIDVSHLNIVAHIEGRRELELTAELLRHANCMEIHVSSNRGRADSHRPIPDIEREWWYPALLQKNRSAWIFAEENYALWWKQYQSERGSQQRTGHARY